MSDARATSYANAWLALLPKAHLPTIAAQAVARECAKYANWTTGQNVFPGRKLLAWNLNTSQDTVKVAMGVCVAHGVLKPVTKGGMRGPVNVAAVYCLSVPEHLATAENLATFPDASAVVIVRPKVVSEPKYPANNPHELPPVGNGLPTENPSIRNPSGEPVTRPVGRGVPAQRVAGSPPPSMDPPGNPLIPPTAPEGSPEPTPRVTPGSNDDASRQAAADADGRMPPSAAFLAARATLGRSGDWGTAGGRTGSDLGKQRPKGMPSPLPTTGSTTITPTGESPC